jgi:nitrilase
MSTKLKVAGIQMISGSVVSENLDRVSILVEQAAQQGAQLVALPEYFCAIGASDSAKRRMAEPFNQTASESPIQSALAALAKQYGIWLAGGTVPILNQPCDPSGRFFNSQLVYSPLGEVVARYDKIHLFDFKTASESYDEAQTILPGKRSVKFDCGFATVGLSICYDLRFPELYRSLLPVDLILVPAAFTATTGRAHWETLLRARAIENQAYVLAPAQGGEHPSGRKTWGHSLLIDPWGEIMSSLTYGEGLVMGELCRSRLDEVRQNLPALEHRVIGI